MGRMETSGFGSFGKFNDAITDRPKTEAYLQVFPIHANTLAVNQNLTQNPGYSK